MGWGFCSTRQQTLFTYTLKEIQDKKKKKEEKKGGGGGHQSKTEENGVSVKMLHVAGGRLHCGGMFAGSTPTLQQEESEVPGGGWSHYA